MEITRVVNGVIHHHYTLDYAVYDEEKVLNRFGSFSEAYDWGIKNNGYYIFNEKTQTSSLLKIFR